MRRWIIMVCLLTFTAGNMAAAAHLCESRRGADGVAASTMVDVIPDRAEDAPLPHGGGETPGGAPHCNLCAQAATFALTAAPSSVGFLGLRDPAPEAPPSARLPLAIPDRLDEPPRG